MPKNLKKWKKTYEKNYQKLEGPVNLSMKLERKNSLSMKIKKTLDKQNNIYNN